MKKHASPRVVGVSALVAGALILSACAGDADEPTTTSSAAAIDGPLIIASWGGAYSQATREHIAAAFTADTGIEVQVLDTGNHVASLQQMADADATEWDIVEGESWVDSIFMYEQGLLADLPSDLHQELVDAYGPENVTDYGWTWSGYGAAIVCNRETVEVCPTTVQELFDPVGFPGTRMLPGDPSGFNALVTALAVATGSPRDALYSDETDITVFADKLAEVKDSVGVWTTAGDQQNQAMLQGQADMGIMWSGRAFQLIDEGMDLEISWDGAYMVGLSIVPEGAPHKEAAWEFARWLAENPEHQANWAAAMNYTVASPDIFDHLPQDVAERLATYPTNYEQLILQDFEWHAEHKTELDAAFLSVIQG